jgi:pimeloyl-ACP methyl ester carboxylesterase
VAHLDAPSLTVDLPGRGLTPEDAAPPTLHTLHESAIAALDGFTEVERVVLVGPSMAGLTVPAVAGARPDRIAHLVMVSCFAPTDGNSVTDEMSALMRLVNRSGLGVRANGTLSPHAAVLAFGNGMTREQKHFLRDRIVPEDVSVVITEPVSRSGLPPASHVPRTYIKLLKDRAHRPSMQDRFIARLGDCAVRTIDSGHDVMIGRPQELAMTLNQIRSESVRD